MRTRGKWFDYDTGTRTIRAIATFHPAYLLRSPSYKRMSWQDLRSIAKALEQAAAKRGRPWPRSRSALSASHDARTSILRDGTDRSQDGLRVERGNSSPFGRTMAQPIRSKRLAAVHQPVEGVRHFRHQARKTLAISAGGVPAVSEARQTTTPPVRLNFSSVSHGVRSGVASR